MLTIDMSGQQFGRLTVLERAGSGKDGAAKWLCLCECGTTKAMRGADLRSGHSRSCGCLSREILITTRTTHGDSRGGMTGEYMTWCHLIQRCTNSNNPKWPLYGGRGIKVCDRWRNSYASFLADMGRKPAPDYSIDRIDNDGDYEPDNCRWATRSEQNRNRRPWHRSQTVSTEVML